MHAVADPIVRNKKRELSKSMNAVVGIVRLISSITLHQTQKSNPMKKEKGRKEKKKRKKAPMQSTPLVRGPHADPPSVPREDETFVFLVDEKEKREKERMERKEKR